jgi:hypothetical protein
MYSREMHPDKGAHAFWLLMKAHASSGNSKLLLQTTNLLNTKIVLNNGLVHEYNTTNIIWKECRTQFPFKSIEGLPLELFEDFVRLQWWKSKIEDTLEDHIDTSKEADVRQLNDAVQKCNDIGELTVVVNTFHAKRMFQTVLTVNDTSTTLSVQTDLTTDPQEMRVLVAKSKEIRTALDSYKATPIQRKCFTTNVDGITYNTSQIDNGLYSKFPKEITDCLTYVRRYMNQPIKTSSKEQVSGSTGSKNQTALKRPADSEGEKTSTRGKWDGNSNKHLKDDQKKVGKGSRGKGKGDGGYDDRKDFSYQTSGYGSHSQYPHDSSYHQTSNHGNGNQYNRQRSSNQNTWPEDSDRNGYRQTYQHSSYNSGAKGGKGKGQSSGKGQNAKGKGKGKGSTDTRPGVYGPSRSERHPGRNDKE